MGIIHKTIDVPRSSPCSSTDLRDPTGWKGVTVISGELCHSHTSEVAVSVEGMAGSMFGVDAISDNSML